jgi:phosphohistidine phosphatase
LVQHGEAKSEKEDPERPLTDKGREEVLKVASHISELGIKVSQIIHSGRLRARQTAEIFDQYLHPVYGTEEQSGLSPLDDPQKTKAWIEKAKEPLMIVGHLPHLNHLLASLILNDPRKEIVSFRMGGIVCLTDTEGKWRIRWMLTPEVVKEA